MQIQEQYEVPFKEFERRTSLFTLIKDLYQNAAIAEIEKLKEGDFTMEWKGDEALLSYAVENNLFGKIQEKVHKQLLLDTL